MISRHDEEAPAGLGKPWYATVGLTAGTGAAAMDVERWYDQQLRASGWQAMGGSDLPPAHPQERIVWWQRGDLIFRLAFYRQNQAGATPAGQAAAYSTAFGVELTPRR